MTPSLINGCFMSEQMANEQASTILLEFTQDDTGRFVLREAKNKTEVLLAIDFSDKLKTMFGEDAYHIGEHMLQTAMTAMMCRQADEWHANVFDEEPKFYS